ncbi:hypothetical protein Ciccas_010666 [Cichlidogyrus casuarinus]|uniref:LIM zinc-binding domain-containing protein n=1 Tax=Cichlidogyrus casuarinus TaxID=1844966 RepID=A0ABD2PV58_9PLAT
MRDIVVCRRCYRIRTKKSFKKCAECNDHISNKKEGIQYLGAWYHASHFKCFKCGHELDNTGREVDKELFCNRCYLASWAGNVCAACHRPIENELTVIAFGKTWHTEHFACGLCDKAFKGNSAFELKGKAYCLEHYDTLSELEVCYECFKPPQLSLPHMPQLSYKNKIFCLDHFICCQCDTPLVNKSWVYDLDYRPLCGSCLKALPRSFRKSLAETHRKESLDKR